MTRFSTINGSGSRSRGLTLLEVLVAVCLLTLLSALSVPLLQSWRVASRAAQCHANLMAIGLAVQSYESSHQMLPPAATWSATGLNLDRFPRVSPTVQVTYGNWVHGILPYLDEHQLLEQFDLKLPMIHPQNEKGRLSSLTTMICPSDTFNSASNRYVYTLEDGTEAAFARGNYAINGGPQAFRDQPGSLMSPRPYGTISTIDFETEQVEWWGDGVAGFNKAFSYKDFTNGLSTMVLVNELRAGVHSLDPRGVWSLGQIGGSITWAHGRQGDASGPNPTNHHADDILRGDKLHELLGPEWIEAEGMTCCDHCDVNDQAGSRSTHPGGVNALFCDGAVMFIPNEVDDGVWQELHSRSAPPQLLSGLRDNLPQKEQREAELPSVSMPPISETRPPLDESLENSVEMRFALIYPGEFVMGLHDEGNTFELPPETPAHQVKLTSPFYMAVHEVTQKQFQEVMGFNPSRSATRQEGDFSPADPRALDRPVENVSWHEAHDFCQRLSELHSERTAGRSYRLPTEAEWEYCSRSGKVEPYRYDRQWRDDDTSGEIANKRWKEPLPVVLPVGSYAPNDFGLYDMRGNVWEWVSDWYQRDYYSWSRYIDPQGPATGLLKTYRGADWIHVGCNCKTGSRCGPPRMRNPYIGFRVVCQLNSK